MSANIQSSQLQTNFTHCSGNAKSAKRAAPVSIRFTPSEKQSLEVAAAGEALGPYIKRCVLKQHRVKRKPHALEERGYILAKGRRGHVAVDYKGEAYAVSRYVGLRAKDVRAKLSEADGLPSFEEAHAKARKQVTDRLATLLDEQKRSAESVGRKAEHSKAIEKQRSQARSDALQRRQTEERAKQADEQQKRLRNPRSDPDGWQTRKTGTQRDRLCHDDPVRGLDWRHL